MVRCVGMSDCAYRRRAVYVAYLSTLARPRKRDGRSTERWDEPVGQPALYYNVPVSWQAGKSRSLGVCEAGSLRGLV
jgi:hypothetical protein